MTREWPPISDFFFLFDDGRSNFGNSLLEFDIVMGSQIAMIRYYILLSDLLFYNRNKRGLCNNMTLD